jgi:hypothetical protein
MAPSIVNNLILRSSRGSWTTTATPAKTKILKLLYLFDVEYYRFHRRTFTNFEWKFFHLGPWAAEYDSTLSGLVAQGVLSEDRSNSYEYDTALYRPGERVERRRAVTTVKDESILLQVLNRWGRSTTAKS